MVPRRFPPPWSAEVTPNCSVQSDVTIASAATHARLAIHNFEPTGALLPTVVDKHQSVCSPEGW